MMCLWIPTEQSYTEICFRLQISEDPRLHEGKISPGGCTDNINNTEKVLFP